MLSSFHPISLKISQWGFGIAFCLSALAEGFMEAILCTASMEQSYIVHHRPVLCTTNLHCTMVHKGGLFFNTLCLSYHAYVVNNDGRAQCMEFRQGTKFLLG